MPAPILVRGGAGFLIYPDTARHKHIQNAGPHVGERRVLVPDFTEIVQPEQIQNAGAHFGQSRVLVSAFTGLFDKSRAAG